MKNSILWLAWCCLPVFAVSYHYGPGQEWLARDRAAGLIREATQLSLVAESEQELAYESQLVMLNARREAFLEGVDWQTTSEHPLSIAVQEATTQQQAAYAKAADSWNRTSEVYLDATELLLDTLDKSSEPVLSESDQNLLESLRWAEARAMVRSGYVFDGVEQLQALLDLRLASATDQPLVPTNSTRPVSSSAADSLTQQPSGTSRNLPTSAIREELAAAQYIGARLLREEGRSPEVWKPIANLARQQYRYLADRSTTVSKTRQPGQQRQATASEDFADERLSSGDRVQRNLEQVLNLERSSSEQLEGIPLPRQAPMARRPGDGPPGDKPGKGPGRGPLRDGPPGDGAGIPRPYGAGW
ncbi:hypothetical protein OAL35_02280 [bacterium]|nr:hypothetical protein [bacterium]